MSELCGCGNTFWARKLGRFSGKIYHLNDEGSKIFVVLWSTAPCSYWFRVGGSNYDVLYSHWCETYQVSVWAFSLPVSGAAPVCTHSVEFNSFNWNFLSWHEVPVYWSAWIQLMSDMERKPNLFYLPLTALNVAIKIVCNVCHPETHVKTFFFVCLLAFLITFFPVMTGKSPYLCSHSAFISFCVICIIGRLNETQNWHTEKLRSLCLTEFLSIIWNFHTI